MKIEKKYYDSGHLYKETYFLDNIVHRDDGPAEICYYPSGKIASEEYYVNGKRHRINGPAYITYEEYGDIISEQHWINDMAHRLDGPAFIQHYEYDITRETYFVNDICLEDFEEYCYYSQPQLQKQKGFIHEIITSFMNAKNVVVLGLILNQLRSLELNSAILHLGGLKLKRLEKCLRFL